MDITNTNNLTLANAIDVDPSMISLIRTGRRGIPRNKSHVQKMAQYFADHIGSNMQLQQLSEALEFPKLNTSFQAQDMPKLLYNWMCGTADYSNSLQDFGRSIDKAEDNAENKTISSALYFADQTGSRQNEIYIGNEGKLKALCDFYEYTLSLEEPSTIYITCDENPEWYAYDIQVAQRTSEYRRRIMAKGWKICHILPPVSSPDFYSILGRWIPSYLTGNIDVFYYPRVRDYLFRQTIFVIPDKIAMYSTSVWNSMTTHITHLFFDPKIISPYMQTFNDYLAFCKPAFITHIDIASIMECFKRNMNINEPNCNRIQKGRTLSIESLPLKQLYEYIPVNDDFRKSMLSYIQEFDISYEDKYKNHISTDICPLATASQVREGRVPLLFPGLDNDKVIYYTPQTYVIHLKNILHLLNNYDNYHFIPIPFNEEDEDTFIVNENVSALLARTVSPIALFEFVQFELINALNEHLNRIVDNTGFAAYNLSTRKKIISKIRHIINELED
jgi:hypothetical protein